MKLATRRLIDAAATLPAADRALLSLWTQRGLDNAAMAQMTGVDPATIAERRDRIVADLSAELGLPPQDVADALSAIAQSAAASVALQDEPVATPSAEQPSSGNGGTAAIDPADPVISAASAAPAPVPTASGTPHSQAEIEPLGAHPKPQDELKPLPSESPQRRRWLVWAAAALVGVAVVIVVVVIAASSGGGAGHPASVANATSTTGSAAAASSPPAAGSTSASATSAASATVPPAPAAGPRTLGPLPGGIAGATGTVTLASGSAGTQRLRVQASGLPAAGGDHYEVWLYNSIIDSAPLGRLGPSGAGSFTLPAVVARFASIDISRQPPGMTQPSGASVLRTTNPLAASSH